MTINYTDKETFTDNILDVVPVEEVKSLAPGTCFVLFENWRDELYSVTVEFVDTDDLKESVHFRTCTSLTDWVGDFIDYGSSWYLKRKV